MPVAVACDGGAAGALVDRAQACDVRALFLRSAVVRPRSLRAELRANGIAVCGIGSDEDVGAAEPAASVLRAGAVVVDVAPGEDDREAAVERVARALHGPLTRGVPLAVRNGSLLGLEEIAWLFEALPRLGLWFDADRAGAGSITPWADAHAGRCTGVFLGVHPDALGRGLAEAFPRRVPWVLDLEGDELADGIKALRAMLRA